MDLPVFNYENFTGTADLFIEASAGTGKTYTIIEMVARLLSTTTIDKILLVTYTEKAAAEIKERLREKLQELNRPDQLKLLPRATIGTIHSFCQKTIGELFFECQTNPLLQVKSDNLSAFLVDKALRDDWNQTTEGRYVINNDLNSVTTIKNGLAKYQPTLMALEEHPVEIEGSGPCPVKSHFIAGLKQEWQQQKELYKYLTYNDMLEIVCQAVTNDNGEITPLCQALRQRYQFAIIDEFQDTNKLQWTIFKKVFLESPANKIFVVGDPKQSIYSFQGADIEVYKKATREIGNGYRLQKNYRSTAPMVESLNALFATDTSRTPRKGVTYQLPAFGLGDFHPSMADHQSDDFQPYFQGQRISAPLWLSPEDIEAREFARLAVEQLAGFFKLDENGQTALQVYHKDEKKRGNLRLSDIAILCRTRSELDEIQKQLKQVGLPYTSCGQDNIFASREASHFVTLLQAINVTYLGSRNIKLLRSALATQFFNWPVKNLLTQSEEALLEQHGPLFAKWHQLARNCNWAELFEELFGPDTKLYLLNNPKQLSQYNRYQQLADYSINYLYNNGTALLQLIAHLNKLAQNATASEQDDSSRPIKNSDFEQINILTIHAAKGLEFPVVIVVGGDKGFNNRVQEPFLVNGPDSDKKVLSFVSDKKELYKENSFAEYCRLFYVAYTRASQLLILPRYPIKSGNKNKDMQFLRLAIDSCLAQNPAYFLELPAPTDANVAPIIANYLQHQQMVQNDSTPFGKLLIAPTESYLHQTSYSKLAHQQINRNETPEIDQEQTAQTIAMPTNQPVPWPEDYPKGAHLGTALHAIFEHLDFTRATNNLHLGYLTRQAFLLQGLPIDQHRNWLNYTVEMVQSVLSTPLPGPFGGFELAQITMNQRAQEMEFFLYLDNLRLAHGFVDLLFRHHNRYYLLDWKSDILPEYDQDNMTMRMEERRYNLQQLLYSYMLIKWLKTFPAYQQKSLEEIFQEDFGGMYYCFLRGFNTTTKAGFYLQTYQSFNELETAYQQVVLNRGK